MHKVRTYTDGSGTTMHKWGKRSREGGGSLKEIGSNQPTKTQDFFRPSLRVLLQIYSYVGVAYKISYEATIELTHTDTGPHPSLRK